MNAENQRLQAANADLQRNRDQLEDEKDDLRKDLERQTKENDRWCVYANERFRQPVPVYMHLSIPPRHFTYTQTLYFIVKMIFEIIEFSLVQLAVKFGGTGFLRRQLETRCRPTSMCVCTSLKAKAVNGCISLLKSHIPQIKTVNNAL